MKYRIGMLAVGVAAATLSSVALADTIDDVIAGLPALFGTPTDSGVAPLRETLWAEPFGSDPEDSMANVSFTLQGLDGASITRGSSAGADIDLTFHAASVSSDARHPLDLIITHLGSESRQAFALHQPLSKPSLRVLFPHECNNLLHRLLV